MRGSGSTEEYRKEAEAVYQKSRKHINYDVINQWLRNNDIQDRDSRLDTLAKDRDSTIRRIVSVIKTLDDKTQSSRDKKSRTMVLYRGISHRRYNYILDTGVLVNKAFLSTSRNKLVARQFGPVMLEIRVPVDIGAYKFINQGEEEMLIERNTQCVNFKELGENVILGEKNGHAVKCDRLVRCEIAKYQPPTQQQIKVVRKNMSDVVSEFIEKMKLEDEEIDWDKI